MPSDITASITIRTAEKQDVPTLTQLAREIYADAFGASTTVDDLAAELEIFLSAQKIERYITEDVVLLAEYEGRMIGYTHLSAINIPVETPANESAQLRRFYVHWDFQSRGIGALLMQASLAHPLLYKAKYVYLEVWSLNIRAQQFYKRHGFVKVGENTYTLPSGKEGDPEFVMRHKS